MSKKFGKFLLFSAVAGAAAYGAYQYLQAKDKTAAPVNTDDADDDLDEFNEDLDEEPAPEKDRSYVSLNLDKAAAIASESFHKAKEVIADSVQQVRATVKSVTEGQVSSETNFTDLTALQKESEVPKAETPQGETSETETPEGDASGSEVPEAETTSDEPLTEEFFSQEAPEAESPVPAKEPVESVPTGSDGSNEKVEDFFDDDDTL